MHHSPYLRLLAASVAVAVGLLACNKAEKTPPAPTAAPPHEAAHAAAVETLDRMAATDTTAASAMQSIAGRLQQEAASRPAGTIKAEDVFASLAKAGLPLTDGPRQYVASVTGAAYCAGGQTADGLGVAVCEYASPEKAVAGKAAVEQRFAALTPVRDIVVRGATTLTLTARPDAPLASSKRTATEAFSTL